MNVMGHDGQVLHAQAQHRRPVQIAHAYDGISERLVQLADCRLCIRHEVTSPRVSHGEPIPGPKIRTMALSNVLNPDGTCRPINPSTARFTPTAVAVNSRHGHPNARPGSTGSPNAMRKTW